MSTSKRQSRIGKVYELLFCWPQLASRGTAFVSISLIFIYFFGKLMSVSKGCLLTGREAYYPCDPHSSSPLFANISFCSFSTSLWCSSWPVLLICWYDMDICPYYLYCSFSRAAFYVFWTLISNGAHDKCFKWMQDMKGSHDDYATAFKSNISSLLSLFSSHLYFLFLPLRVSSSCISLPFPSFVLVLGAFII